MGFSFTVSAEENLIPSWIKNTAGWWASDQLSDEEFVNSMGYLVKTGVISLPVKESVEGIPDENIHNLEKDGTITVWLDGSVPLIPIVPTYLELIHPDGTVSNYEEMPSADGTFQFALFFKDDAQQGIYHAKMFHNNNLFHTDSFKLDVPVSKNSIIPLWIKNNAKWWAEGQIDEESFLGGIQYLVKNRIITIKSDDVGKSFVKSLPSSKYKETHIEGFPDPLKTPEHYLDRYFNEQQYREWFDREFPDTTIFEIIGLIPDESHIFEFMIPDESFTKSQGIKKQENQMFIGSYTGLPSGGTTFVFENKNNISFTISKAQNFDEAMIAVSKIPKVGYLSDVYVIGDVLCAGDRLLLYMCVYDKYIIFQDAKYSDNNAKKLAISLIDETIKKISSIEGKYYVSPLSEKYSLWKNGELIEKFQEFTYMGVVNIDEYTVKFEETESYSEQLEASRISNFGYNVDIQIIECIPFGSDSVKVGYSITNYYDQVISMDLAVQGLDRSGQVITFDTDRVYDLYPQDTVFEISYIDNHSDMKSCNVYINKITTN